MPWGELLLDSFALLVYPGAAAAIALGLGAEVVASRVLRPAPGTQAAIRPWSALGLPLPPLAAAAALLALLATCQLAAPFNPVAPTQRNLLVAAIALASAGWLAWTWRWRQGRLDPQLVLLAQACWLAALLAPALVSQSLRPQVLGAVILPGQLALKVVAGALFLLCLPVLLQLLPEAAPQAAGGDGGQLLGPERAGFAAARVLLWLPQCGLFASVFFPPASEDGAGLIRFAGSALGAAVVGIGLARAIARRPGAARTLYLRVATPLAALALLVAAAIAVLG